MTDFVKTLRSKGWSAQELAERWGVTPRQISNIGKNPNKMNLDALEGLPCKAKYAT